MNPELSPQLEQKLLDLFSSTDRISPEDAEFERMLREDYVYAEKSGSSLFTPEDINECCQLMDLLAADETISSEHLLTCFFLCFEWYHRFGRQEEIARVWEQLLDCTRSRLSGYTLYNYAACCYWYDMRHNEEEGLRLARKIHMQDPHHIGYWNNWAEKVAKRAEDILLGQNGHQRAEYQSRPEVLQDLHDAIKGFEIARQKRDAPYPIYYMTIGRIHACIDSEEDAQKAWEYYDKALKAEQEHYEQSEMKSTNTTLYVTEVAEIISAQSVSRAISSVALTIDLAETQRQHAEQLGQKLSEVEAWLNGEQARMLESLTFFAGIISFVIVTVQIGADTDTPSRAFLILVMLAALLIAFGSFVTCLEMPRKGGQSPLKRFWQNMNPMLIAGLVVLLLAFAFMLVPKP